VRGEKVPAPPRFHVKNTGALWKNSPVSDFLTLVTNEPTDAGEEMRLSALNEIANIGTGHAAIALAQMCQRNFKISVPTVLPVEFDQLRDVIENADAQHGVVYMAIDGDLQGRMAFFLDWSSCQSLWEMLIGYTPADASNLSEIEYSALMEVGNIINGAFLSAFNEFTGVSGLATPPVLAIDCLDGILGSITAEAMEEHVALFIETKLRDDNSSVRGSFLFIPTDESLQLLWNKLGLGVAA
jgi:chemotaxis protein CheC